MIFLREKWDLHELGRNFWQVSEIYSVIYHDQMDIMEKASTFFD